MPGLVDGYSIGRRQDKTFLEGWGVAVKSPEAELPLKEGGSVTTPCTQNTSFFVTELSC